MNYSGFQESCHNNIKINLKEIRYIYVTGLVTVSYEYATEHPGLIKKESC
jgi:hypothetical protein